LVPVLHVDLALEQNPGDEESAEHEEKPHRKLAPFDVSEEGLLGDSPVLEPDADDRQGAQAVELGHVAQGGAAGVAVEGWGFGAG